MFSVSCNVASHMMEVLLLLQFVVIWIACYVFIFEMSLQCFLMCTGWWNVDENVLGTVKDCPLKSIPTLLFRHVTPDDIVKFLFKCLHLG